MLSTFGSSFKNKYDKILPPRMPYYEDFVTPTERSDESSHYGMSHFARNDKTIKLTIIKFFRKIRLNILKEIRARNTFSML